MQWLHPSTQQLHALSGSATQPEAALKQQLEDTKASQSLQPEKAGQPQPMPASQGATPAAQHNPEFPTSVAEDEVDSVIAHVKEADR